MPALLNLKCYSCCETEVCRRMEPWLGMFTVAGQHLTILNLSFLKLSLDQGDLWDALLKKECRESSIAEEILNRDPNYL
ncbi:hypothetical protein M514_09144 [Trichuris suis]|uniref:Uncharacterized protein n=1 Tax=Trichuris suis TaxID=68888 RepID=A0A085MS40_9BILA|nr:hypothetical protein M513_09144 [Trichuris suis]KFD60036.1 hypothetical protein M514_09144 [Trichuris suis]